MDKKRNHTLQFIALCSGFIAMTLGVLFSAGKGLRSLFSGFAKRDAAQYSITLDSSNKVTTSGDVVQHSKLGSNVTFTYNNVNSTTSGHATLNDGGYIVNKARITSIETFKVDFSTSNESIKLLLTASYDGSTWGEEWEAVSSETYTLSSYPYFINMKASGGRVNISSVKYTFTCTENPDAAPTHHEVEGGWDVVTDPDTLVGGDKVLIVGSESNSGPFYALNNGTISSNLWYYLTATQITVTNNGTKAEKEDNHDVWTVGRNGNKFTFLNESNYLYGGIEDGPHYDLSLTNRNGYSNEWTVNAEYTNNSIDFITNSVIFSFYMHNSTPEFKGVGSAPSTNVFLFKYTPGESYDEYDTPVDEIGFTATDSNSNKYTNNSIFASDSNLVVKALLNDGTEVPLSEGENGYSYVILDSFNVEINPNEKFPEPGVYTLIVSYSNYIPLEITLYVGEYIYAVDIAASMEDTTFNTADILNDNLAGNIVATVEYSNGSRGDDISYSEFASAGLGVRLLSPRGFAHDPSTVFGLPGSWTVKVYDLSNDQLFYEISIEVEAIPVVSITLNETSYELHPGNTLQLQATVGPANATNNAIEWSSNNTDVATVDEDGLVTAVSVGGATITALAADGSNVFGTCSISVTEAPPEPETLTITLNSFTNATNAYAMYDWTQKTSDNTSISGKGEIYKDSKSVSMQFNSSKGSKTGAIFNTVAIPGGITKIEATTASGTNKSWSAYVSSTAYSYSNSEIVAGNNATQIGDGITVDTSRTSLGTSTSGYSFFYLEEAEGGASYLSEIVISYSESSATPVSPTYPTSISVSGNNAITIGETSQLDVTYSPSDTNVKNVTWSSSNSNVATVSSTGLVTGVAEGSVTITATAEAKNGTVQATRTITVSPIAVTSVVLDQSSASVKAGKTVTLVPTIYPNSATNRNVTWSSSNTSVATVSAAGVVTGVSAGTTTITVTTVDGNKTAQCVVTVTESSAGYFEDVIDNAATHSDLSGYSTSTWNEFTLTGSSGTSYHIRSMGTKGTSNALQWNTNGYLYSTSSEGILYRVSAELPSGKSIIVYGSNTAFSSNSGGTELGTILGSGSITPEGSYEYIRIKGGSSGTAITSITIEYGTPTPVDPTSILVSPSTLELAPGGTQQLSVSYVPSNANQNKDVTWTSSNTNVATVASDGSVSVKSTATAGQTATITAKLTNLPTIKATATITVVAQKNDDHTVLIYMCGADLESKNGLASGDIAEILKISNQPSDVNIVIETGGANSWSSSYNYGISSTKLERWHVENRSLIKDASLSYASMGLTSTLQSFIEYGLKNYPADRTGLVFWNHGGGMRGVCYDEKKDDDVLKNSEIRSALSGAYSNCGISGQKLEWVGYDACLMAVQDIAITNAQYFNYMIASEESEAGYGWDYDTWVDDLYAKKATTTILKAIVDGFIADNGGASSSSGDQTLSYMNLAYAAAYKTAWENLAAQLNTVVTSTNKSSFNSAITSNVKHYADSDYDYFCTFDAYDFVDKLEKNSAFSNFRVDSIYTDAVKTALANLVAYNLAQKGAGVSKGLCMYWPNSTKYSDVTTYYTTSETTLTTWRSFCVNKGFHN